MKTTTKITLLFLTAFFSCGCNKDSENYILRHYAKKLSGQHNFKGEYHCTAFRLIDPNTMSYTRYDSASPWLDTFDIKVTNNRSINLRDLDFNFNKVYKPLEAIIYERIGTSRYPNFEYIYYFYKKDSIVYTLYNQNESRPYYYILHTS